MNTPPLPTDEPLPPPGYQPAYRFVYPTLLLQGGAVVLLVLCLPLLAVLTWWLQGSPADITFNLEGGKMLAIIAVVIFTIVAHELVHGLALRWLGYRVSFGVIPRMLAAYAAAFGQFQQRDHNLIVALAPLLVLTPVLVPLLAFPEPLVVLMAFSALLMNTTGAVGDIYLSWRLLRLPRTSLLYDVSVERMLIFEPEPPAADSRPG